MAFEGLNEKLKNLGKKDSEPLKSGIGDFFKKNAFLKYLIPVMIFIIATAVFIVMVFSDGTLGKEMEPLPTEGVSPTDNTAVILPNDSNIVGTTDPGLAALIQRDPLSEEILAGAKYNGCVIVASSSLRVAIINNGGVEYRLCVGDCLGDSSWQVAEITESAVTFTAGNTTKTLKYSG
ncbi:MAG: hypothetical protein BWY46_00992 [Firmicutes bacterium ADurb.Bin300]|nr:MAG: hypothetical protein BWY46_00992 [Firmicutes bacterium ADurb.Bin300]HOD02830.1 hypothetical protein [Clostridiales bacterium]